MKKYLSLLIVLILTICSGLYAKTEGEEQKKKKVQIIIIEDGKKEVIDTLISDINLDEFLLNLDINVDSIVRQARKTHKEAMMKFKEQMKEFKDHHHGWIDQLKEFEFDMDAFCDSTRIFLSPKHFHFLVPPQYQSEKIIDLNDPNIISFQRKKIDGDKEKITIIRKIPEEEKE